MGGNNTRHVAQPPAPSCWCGSVGQVPTPTPTPIHPRLVCIEAERPNIHGCSPRGRGRLWVLIWILTLNWRSIYSVQIKHRVSNPFSGVCFHSGLQWRNFAQLVLQKLPTTKKNAWSFYVLKGIKSQWVCMGFGVGLFSPLFAASLSIYIRVGDKNK